MGIIKRKNKKFDYQARYYKGEGNPYEIKQKFDQFRSTSGNGVGLKGKINNAIGELKGENTGVEFDNKTYQLETPERNTSKVVIYIIAVLVLVFLFIIDFDLSIFSKK